jgi:hypothetical protein
MREPLRVEGAASWIFATGLSPSLDGGVAVSGVLFPPGVSVGLRGYAAVFLPTPVNRDGAQGTFDLLYVGGALCPALRGEVATGMLCVGGQLGVMRSHADTEQRGIEQKTLPLVNAVGEARVSFPVIAPVAITAGVAAIVPVLRPTFEYTAAGPTTANLHKVSPLAGSGDVGIAFFFP